MKRLLVLIVISIFVFAGCEKTVVDFKDDVVLIDDSAQTKILETNGNIQTMFVYDIDNEKYVRYVLSDDGRIVTCTGEWFNVTLDFSRPEEIQLAVLPNTSGKDRSIRIEAQRFGKGTSVEVSQKAV